MIYKSQGATFDEVVYRYDVTHCQLLVRGKHNETEAEALELFSVFFLCWLVCPILTRSQVTYRFNDSVVVGEPLNIILFLRYAGKCRLRKVISALTSGFS